MVPVETDIARNTIFRMQISLAVYSFGDTISSVVWWCRLMGNNWGAICWSFSGNSISSVTSRIPGSVSSFSEEYIVYVYTYFKSYIDKVGRRYPAGFFFRAHSKSVKDLYFAPTRSALSSSSILKIISVRKCALYSENYSYQWNLWA